jgi:hypothetical protein
MSFNCISTCSDGQLIYELERTWKQTVVTYFNLLFQRLSVRNKGVFDNHSQNRTTFLSQRQEKDALCLGKWKHLKASTLRKGSLWKSVILGNIVMLQVRTREAVCRF